MTPSTLPQYATPSHHTAKYEWMDGHESPILAGLGEQDGVQTKICKLARNCQPTRERHGPSSSLQDGGLWVSWAVVTLSSSGTFPCEAINRATRYLLSVQWHLGMSACLEEDVEGGSHHRQG